MTREEMISKLVWVQGHSFGICAVGNALRWALDKPGPGKPDLPSIVAIDGNPNDYSDEELRKICEFSDEATARYDEIFRVRRGANLYIFGKVEHRPGQWLRKKLTWEIGPMYSPSLDEAITFMRKACRLVAA